MEIKIEHQPRQEHLNELGVFKWEIWKKEVSKFPWTYDSQEICYFLEGDVLVTPDGGQPVQMGKGDLVIFPAGMSCIWEIQGTSRSIITLISEDSKLIPFVFSLIQKTNIS